jgi:DNA-binding beta-propeller fold protein YncE
VDSEYFGNFGGYGEGEGQFVWPCCGATDSQGRFYLTDESLCRIVVFDELGKPLTHWGTKGSGHGELDTPSGIAFDSEDHCYVSDTYNNRVQKFTAAGRFLSAIGDQVLNLPWGVTADFHGNVYVADWGNDRIQKFSPEGQHIAGFGVSGEGDGQFRRPSSVAVDRDGYISAADWGNERVQVLDAEGQFVTKLRGEATLSKWAENFLNINKEEAAARATADLEKEIDYPVKTPHEESSHIEKLFWSPVSVKLDKDGLLYVTETGRHRIQVFGRAA